MQLRTCRCAMRASVDLPIIAMPSPTEPEGAKGESPYPISNDSPRDATSMAISYFLLLMVQAPFFFVNVICIRQI